MSLPDNLTIQGGGMTPAECIPFSYKYRYVFYILPIILVIFIYIYKKKCDEINEMTYEDYGKIFFPKFITYYNGNKDASLGEEDQKLYDNLLTNTGTNGMISDQAREFCNLLAPCSCCEVPGYAYPEKCCNVPGYSDKQKICKKK